MDSRDAQTPSDNSPSFGLESHLGKAQLVFTDGMYEPLNDQPAGV